MFCPGRKQRPVAPRGRVMARFVSLQPVPNTGAPAGHGSWPTRASITCPWHLPGESLLPPDWAVRSWVLHQVPGRLTDRRRRSGAGGGSARCPGGWPCLGAPPRGPRGRGHMQDLLPPREITKAGSRNPTHVPVFLGPLGCRLSTLSVTLAVATRRASCKEGLQRGLGRKNLLL